MTERRTRLLVVGLDGATFDLIQPWVDAGALPTLGGLKEQGAWGTLHSTIPPLTPPAWVSSVTGVNPGKHGILDFIKGKQQYRQHGVRSTDWRVEPVWLRFGREGLKVGVINFPITYPPFAVNGFMISGMMTPVDATDDTHPAALSARVKRWLGRAGLRLDEKNLSFGRRRAFLEDLQRVARQQTDVAGRLARMFDVDLLHIVYDGTDRVQHYFWRFMDDPASAPAAGAEAIFDHYRCLDQCLATLIAALPSESVVIIHSDHGFQGLRRRIHIENILADMGLLACQRPSPSPSVRWKRRLSKEQVEALAYRLGLGTTLKRLLPPSWKNALAGAPLAPYQHIDWRRTKAFFASRSNQSIRINLKGREPEGIVEPGREYRALCQQIREALIALRDPATGRPVIRRVDRREEIYHGPCLEQADDLIVQSAPGAYLVGNGGRQFISDPEENGLEWSGIHRAEGMVILSGPGLKRGHQMQPARIEDIAPTMLYLMGVAVPDYMDGHVLTGAFESGFLRAHPVSRQHQALPPAPASSNQWDVREADVLARLRDLGYIE